MPDHEQRSLPDDEQEYYQLWFQKIETLFAALRGRSLLLSPADYHLALEWFRKGIPLSCVLRGIREAFYRRLAEGDMEDEILSLRWCAWAVTKEWKAYKSALATEVDVTARETEAEPTADETAAVLDSLGFDLQSSIALCHEKEYRQLEQTLETVAGQLADLSRRRNAGGMDADQFDAALRELDERMMSSVLEQYPADARTPLEKSVDRKLKTQAAGMDAAARERTRRAALSARIRLELRLPRLTLYAL